MQRRSSSFIASATAGMVALLGGPGAVQADCAAPEPELIWSYPADGDANVPVDAMIFLVPSTRIESARLDGEQVTVMSWDRIDPGGLAPDAEHVLELTLTDYNEGEPASISVHFTTGDATAPPPARDPIRVLGHERVGEPQGKPGLCNEIPWVWECWDTGPVSLVEFEADVEAPLLWEIRVYQLDSEHIYLWPAVCGAPTVPGFALRDETCIEVVSRNPAGDGEASDTYCPQPEAAMNPEPASEPQSEPAAGATSEPAPSGAPESPTAPTTSSGGDGCSAFGGESAGGWWFAWLLALATRRRRGKVRP